MKKTKVSFWKCPQCGREFEHHNQAHSCKIYPLELHFKDMEASKTLYKKLCNEIREENGPFKIESLECCIHLVSTSTFAAVKILQNKLQIDFSLNHEIKNKRFKKSLKISKNRFLYLLEITKKEEIDKELLNWIKEAQELKQKKITYQE